jgi:hypothetical protein
MADHKFVYTVSGVDLSDAQKTKISQEIAVAVTRALIGASPEELPADHLSLCRINGGKWIPTDEVERLGGIGAVEAE